MKRIAYVTLALLATIIPNLVSANISGTLANSGTTFDSTGTGLILNTNNPTGPRTRIIRYTSGSGTGQDDRTGTTNTWDFRSVRKSIARQRGMEKASDSKHDTCDRRQSRKAICT